MSNRVLLLSLRPRFADAILDGTKTVELRRRPVNAAPGTRVILYSTAPTMAIVGTAHLGMVDIREPRVAWSRHRKSLGLSKDEFDAYLEGSERAYLLHLAQVCRLDEPLHLHQLRRSGGFRPPQSFRYIAESDPHPLRELVAAV